MQNSNLLVRATQVSALLTQPRSKSETISETAKSMIEAVALKDLYGIEESFESKYTDKGLMMEATAIELVNRLLFGEYKKNEERANNGRFAGTPDVVWGKEIRDVKCSWSAQTFPWTIEAALKQIKKGGYEEQVRTYMMLFDCDVAYIDFCLLSTPDFLLREAEFEAHQYDHIPESKRLTSVRFDRDREWEDKANAAWEVANQYYLEFVEQLKMK